MRKRVVRISRRASSSRSVRTTNARRRVCEGTWATVSVSSSRTNCTSSANTPRQTAPSAGLTAMPGDDAESKSASQAKAASRAAPPASTSGGATRAGCRPGVNPESQVATGSSSANSPQATTGQTDSREAEPASRFWTIDLSLSGNDGTNAIRSSPVSWRENSPPKTRS